MKPCPFCRSDDVRVFTHPGNGEPYPSANITMVICQTCMASGPAVKTAHKWRQRDVGDEVKLEAVLRWERRT
jgi:hypothetical protein